VSAGVDLDRALTQLRESTDPAGRREATRLLYGAADGLFQAVLDVELYFRVGDGRGRLPETPVIRVGQAAAELASACGRLHDAVDAELVDAG
jgi:hypothetical protein